ncbi:response regulator transcription factor [Cohnella fermenti]|uniref:Response regulator n=1 Tax=Cohnella fermenti TaxID=2565925 RepID=A0A4S4BSX4_9BACL|nr:response regulator [Cohnella fermenti]THF77600.1 response regulator [Cohnella fermenti]
MNVMVVDDEYGIRSYLAAMLQGMEGLTVREAANGSDALQQMEAEPPAVVLTDIKMPVMDGLELIRQSRSRYPDAWFVVLSNFAEFELAQRALEYGARNYLLKATVTRDKLAEEVRKAKRHYAESKDKAAAVTFNANERLMVQNSLFYERLEGRIHNAELCSRAERLHISAFRAQAYESPSRFAVLEIARFAGWTGSKFGGHGDLAIYALSNVVREAIQRRNAHNELFHAGQNRFVLLDLGETDDARHAGTIAEVLAETQRYLGLAASCLIHCDFAGLDGFFRRVALALEQADCLFYEPDACVVDTRTATVVEADLDLFAFFQSVEGGSNGRLTASGLPGLVATYFELLRHLRRPSASAKSDVRTLVQFMEKGGFSVPAALKSELDSLQAARLADYKEPFARWLGELGDYGRRREEITQALSYIHAHYADRMTLEDLCAHVNLSRSHLSKLFKEQQGVAAMEYVEAYRLKQARMLLRTTRQPIADIAERVGIGDVFYFSKVYKKHYGINPSKDR